MPAFSVTAVNAITPLGLSARQTVAVGRAVGIEPRSIDGLSDETVGMCVVGGLGARVFGVERWVALAKRCLSPLRETIQEPLPIALAVPESGRADDDPCVHAGLLRDLAGDLVLDDAHLAVVRAERAGVGMALERAVQWLNEGHPRVLVGGVDSYYHPGVVAELKAAFRWHGPGVADGFIPGEAAGFFVLETVSAVAPMVLGRVATGYDAAAAKQPRDDVPDIAAEMTTLLADVAATQGQPMTWVLTDLNGEHHRQRWWRLASGRGSVAPVARVEALPRQLGDIGAATGAVAVCMAWVHYASGTAVAPHCTIALHGEDGERAVIALHERSAR